MLASKNKAVFDKCLLDFICPNSDVFEEQLKCEQQLKAARLKMVTENFYQLSAAEKIELISKINPTSNQAGA
jgi:spore coat protein CotF